VFSAQLKNLATALTLAREAETVLNEVCSRTHMPRRLGKEIRILISTRANPERLKHKGKIPVPTAAQKNTYFFKNQTSIKTTIHGVSKATG